MHFISVTVNGVNSNYFTCSRHLNPALQTVRTCLLKKKNIPGFPPAISFFLPSHLRQSGSFPRHARSLRPSALPIRILASEFQNRHWEKLYFVHCAAVFSVIRHPRAKEISIGIPHSGSGFRPLSRLQALSPHRSGFFSGQKQISGLPVSFRSEAAFSSRFDQGILTSHAPRVPFHQIYRGHSAARTRLYELPQISSVLVTPAGVEK